MAASTPNDRAAACDLNVPEQHQELADEAVGARHRDEEKVMIRKSAANTGITLAMPP